MEMRMIKRKLMQPLKKRKYSSLHPDVHFNFSKDINEELRRDYVYEEGREEETKKSNMSDQCIFGCATV